MTPETELTKVKIIGKRISFYHKNPLLKFEWLQNTSVFPEKKIQAKTEWYIEIPPLQISHISKIDSTIKIKVMAIYKIWEDSTTSNMQELERDCEPKVFLRYLLLGIEITSSYMSWIFRYTKYNKIQLYWDILVYMYRGLAYMNLFDLKITAHSSVKLINY